MSGRKVILTNYAGTKSVVVHSKIRPNLDENPSKPGKNLAERKLFSNTIESSMMYKPASGN